MGGSSGRQGKSKDGSTESVTAGAEGGSSVEGGGGGGEVREGQAVQAKRGHAKQIVSTQTGHRQQAFSTQMASRQQASLWADNATWRGMCRPSAGKKQGDEEIGKEE